MIRRTDVAFHRVILVLLSGGMLLSIIFVFLVSLIPIHTFIPLIQDVIRQKSGWRIDMETLDLNWRTSNDFVEFTAKEIAIFDPQDVHMGTISEVKLVFSLPSLILMSDGRVKPKALYLRGVTAFIASPFTSAVPSRRPSSPPSPLHPSVREAEQHCAVRDTSNDAIDFLSLFLALPLQEGTFIFPEIVEITDTYVEVTDPARNQPWRGRNGTFSLHRTENQTVVDATMILDIDTHPVALTLATHHGAQACMLSVNVEVTPIPSKLLATFVPMLRAFDNSEMTLLVDTHLSVTLPWDFTNVRFSLHQIKEGVITFPSDLSPDTLIPQTVRVTTLSVMGLFDRLTSTVDITYLRISLREPDLDVHGTVNVSFADSQSTAQWHLDVQRNGFSSVLRGRLGRPFANADRGIIVTLHEFVPRTFADFLPILAPLSAVSTSLSADVKLRLDEHDTPLSAEISVTGHQGQIMLPGILPQPLDIVDVTINAHVLDLTQDTYQQVDITRFIVTLDPTIISATATLTRQEAILSLSVTIQAHEIPVSSLQYLWPVSVARGVRSWVTRNITQGLVPRTWLTLTGSIPLEHHDAWTMEVPQIGFTAQNLTLRYHPAMPLIHGLDGEGRSDGKQIIIHTQNGYVKPASETEETLTLGQGKIIIGNLDRSDLDQPFTLDLNIKGSIPATLAFLNQEPIVLSQKATILSYLTQGQQTTQLSVKFLLRKDLRFEDIDLSTHIQLHQGVLSNLLDFVTIDTISGTMTYTNGRISGMFNGLSNRVPVTFEISRSFNEAGHSKMQVTGNFAAEFTDLQWIGVPALLASVGWVEVTATVTLANDLRGSVSIDLTRSTFDLPFFGYVKQYDEASVLKGNFLLIENTARMNVHMHAPHLLIAGEGFFSLSQGDRRIDLIGATVGLQVKETRLTGHVQADEQGRYTVSVYSPLFEARSLIDYLKTFTEQDTQEEEADSVTSVPPQSVAPETPLEVRVELHIERMLLATEGSSLNGMVIRTIYRNRSWDQLEVTGRLGMTNRRIAMHVMPRQENPPNVHDKTYDVLIDVEDLGYILSGLALTDRILEGNVHLKGVLISTADDLTAYGTIDVFRYQVRDLPTMIQVINLLPPLGGIELLFKQGTAFDMVTADIQWHNRRLTITHAQIVNTNLRISVREGLVDFETQTLDIVGSVSILEVANRFFETIPGLDVLLVGNEKGGVIATLYRIYGPYDAPFVSINVLSMVTPGVLREYLFPESLP